MNDAARMILETVYYDKRMEVVESVKALPENDKEQLVKALIPILKSEKAQEQNNALYLLGLLGPKASPAVSTIVDIFISNKFVSVNEAEELSKILVQIGGGCVVPILTNALGVPPPEGQSLHFKYRQLIEHLAVFGPAAEHAAPSLAPKCQSWQP